MAEAKNSHERPPASTRPGLAPELAKRAALAAAARRAQIEPFFTDSAKEVLLALAGNPNLKERDLVRLLERKDLPAEVLVEVARHPEARMSYAVKLALARHSKTPRLVSLPILKFLYLFDLVRVCQTPAVPTHVKLVAEQAILSKVESIPRGARITLARRAPGRVAAALLVTTDRELIRAALDNPQLAEVHLVRVLALAHISPLVVGAIAQDDKWSHRYSVRLALIRNPMTPLTLVLAFIPHMTVNDLRDITADRAMPEQVRQYIIGHCNERLQKKPSPASL